MIALNFIKKISVLELKSVLAFENCMNDKSIYTNDLEFKQFMNDIVLNILTPDNINEIKNNISNECIFYEIFYFMFIAKEKGNKEPYFILTYLNNMNYFEHMYVLDTYLDLY